MSSFTYVCSAKPQRPGCTEPVGSERDRPRIVPASWLDVQDPHVVYLSKQAFVMSAVQQELFEAHTVTNSIDDAGGKFAAPSCCLWLHDIDCCELINSTTVCG